MASDADASAEPSPEPKRAHTVAHMLLPQRPIDDSLVEVFDDLTAEAARFIELLREWDDDNSGTTDNREFRIALPVLDMNYTRDESDAVFEWLLYESHRLLNNKHVKLHEQYKAEQKAWLAAAEADEERGEKPKAPPSLEEPKNEIEHWNLFRILAAREEGADVEALEAAARARLTELDSKHATSTTSTFWSRDADGKAKNRHQLRKRSVGIKSWDPDASVQWSDGLRAGAHVRDVADDAEAGVSARVLQGTVLDSTATVEDQLKQANPRIGRSRLPLLRADGMALGGKRRPPRSDWLPT